MQEHPEPISPTLDYVYQMPVYDKLPETGGRFDGQLTASLRRTDYEKDPIFQRLQYEIRAAYEEGWRDGGGDPIRSPSEQEPVGWRKAWMGSQARGFLIANGINTGKVSWK